MNQLSAPINTAQQTTLCKSSQIFVQSTLDTLPGHLTPAGGGHTGRRLHLISSSCTWFPKSQVPHLPTEVWLVDDAAVVVQTSVVGPWDHPRRLPLDPTGRRSGRSAASWTCFQRDYISHYVSHLAPGKPQDPARTRKHFRSEGRLVFYTGPTAAVIQHWVDEGIKRPSQW